MIGTILKTLLKIGLALGAIVAVLAAVFYLTEQKNDYIEVYNDDDGEDLF
ncbi:MAG: hypothetical protein ACK5L3_03490 [Oscillospiraceae bacterium]